MKSKIRKVFSRPSYVQEKEETTNYIDDITESIEIQLAAVKQDGRAINCIKNPTQTVLDYLKTLEVMGS